VTGDAIGAEPSADQASDAAARRPATRVNEPALKDVAGIPIAALQQRLGLGTSAVEAIVSGLRRPGAVQGGFSVYLDLNHWISLAKARVGRPDGARFIPCLDLLVAAAGSGKVIVPLGLTHYMEVANIADVRQRADIHRPRERRAARPEPGARGVPPAAGPRLRRLRGVLAS
jgi:hypothetical protein